MLSLHLTVNVFFSVVAIFSCSGRSIATKDSPILYELSGIVNIKSKSSIATIASLFFYHHNTSFKFVGFTNKVCYKQGFWVIIYFFGSGNLFNYPIINYGNAVTHR